MKRTRAGHAHSDAPARPCDRCPARAARPRARTTDPVVRSGARNTPATIDVFMTRVLDNIDRYWTRTFAQADLPTPSVGFAPVPPGAARVTACGHVADDSAAF